MFKTTAAATYQQQEHKKNKQQRTGSEEPKKKARTHIYFLIKIIIFNGNYVAVPKKTKSA